MTKEVNRCDIELLLVSYALLGEHKKNRQCLFIVGFTICSLTPVVTTWSNQFIASISEAMLSHIRTKMSNYLFALGSSECSPHRWEEPVWLPPIPLVQ